MSASRMSPHSRAQSPHAVLAAFVPTSTSNQRVWAYSGHRQSCAFRGNFFQASIFLAPPFSRPPPLGREQKLVTAVSLVQIFTVVGLRGTDVLDVFVRKAHRGLPTLRHNALEETELKNEDLRAESVGTASRRSVWRSVGHLLFNADWCCVACLAVAQTTR